MNSPTRFLLALSVIGTSFAAQGAISKEHLKFFETKIRPVLANNCYKCHSAREKVKGGLTVDSKKGLLAGGDSGAAIVPGNAKASLLFKAINYQDDYEMPPNAKLPDNVIADFERWINMGAPDPREGKNIATGKDIMEQRKKHWAFLPVKKPRVPSASGRIYNQIDSFVVSELKKKGMSQAPMADRSTLIRRVYFDLIGMPPSAREYENYMSLGGNWYGTMVNDLLRSRHYGERWARHWMDVARYSDTRGPISRNREPAIYPYAWTYRDYLIDAFNDDKPYDQFIMEQLAIDSPKVKPRGGTRKELMPALGFLTLGQRFAGNAHDIIDDRIDVTAKAFLGLTVSCARCHDHKFDPIPTKDYYSWYGIFANSREPEFGKEFTIEDTVASTSRTRDYFEKLKPLMAVYTAKQKVMKMNNKERTKRGISRDAFRKIQNEFRRAMKDISELQASHPYTPEAAHVLQDVPKPRDHNVFLLGDPRSRGEVAPRRFLEVLSKGKREHYNEGSGRYQLARDIASKSNPLTARVMINRIWQHHFGDSFIPTPDDLGNQSDKPVNQPLLDYLSSYFMERGWKIKDVHRLILNSATYRQVSLNNPRNAAKDPYNKMFWRQNVRRLEFEAIRDSILHIGGVLDKKTGGMPVSIGGSFRRSVYAMVDRGNLEETMFHFDFANPDLPTGKRSATTVPLQALFMMNSPLVIEQVKRLCNEIAFRKKENTNDRLDFLYERLYQRKPSSEERRVCQQFLNESPDDNETALDRIAEQKRLASASVQQTKRKARAKGTQAIRMMRQEQTKGITGGETQQRAGLVKWEKLAHSMMMANEMYYVN